MEIILNITAEIDGEWQDGDIELVEDAVLANPHYGVWEIKTDRLIILANSMKITVELDGNDVAQE